MDIDIFTNQGKILMLALDHRGSMEKLLPSSIPIGEHTRTIIAIKRMLITALAGLYSGILVDPEFGLPAYTEAGQNNPAISSTPYLLCIEKSGYTDTDSARTTELEYAVSQLKELGAKGVKLLLFFHPEAKTAAAQLSLTKNVFADCQKAKLPFFLEILNYSLGSQPYDPKELVSVSVEIFLKAGIAADVFKLEFPGDAASCQKVTKLLGKTPWILLTKGGTYEGFVAGLKIAIANGARGFLAGRSIWQDFATLPQGQWEKFINTTVRERFKQISMIV